MNQIYIRAWYVPDDLKGTNYHHNQVFEGGAEKALELAGEIFATGLHVMLYHGPGDETITIWTDTQRFTQR